MRLNERVLCVDDRPDNLLILRETLEPKYMVMCVDSGEKALSAAPHFLPHVILLDIMMPGLNGYDTCRRLRAIPELRNTRIVMVSAKIDVEDRLAAYTLGATDYITKPFDERELLAKVRCWMQMVYKQQVEDIWEEMERTREGVGAALASLAALRDTETGDHLLRVRWYTEALAEQLSLGGPYQQEIDEQFLQQLYQAAPLHDIGKSGLPDIVLRNERIPEGDDFEILKHHAVLGGEILAEAAARLPGAEYLRMAAAIARHHHERFDGEGYPDRLSGVNIPLAARIVAVADIFDALTTKPIWDRPLDTLEAIRVIQVHSGSHYDPAIVDALQSRWTDFEQAQAMFGQGLIAPLPEHVGGAALQRPLFGGIDHIEHALTPESLTSTLFSPPAAVVY